MTLPNLASGPVPASVAPMPLVPNAAPATSGLSFGDMLDAVNPLQHIPIVSSLYRAATNTSISSASQVAGDTLYGALLPGGAIAGFASSVANVAVKQVTGKDMGQLALSAVTPAVPAPVGTPLVATKAPAATTPATSPVLPAPFSHTDLATSQYQRAQAFDALNARLVKMAV